MKLLKKIAIKIIVNIFVFLLIWLICTPKVTYARFNIPIADSGGGAPSKSEELLRQDFVNVVIKFVNEHWAQCVYPTSNLFALRSQTYHNGPNYGAYNFDCVGWVCCALHWFLKWGDEADTELEVFVQPECVNRTDLLEEMTIGEAMPEPGDILMFDNGIRQHVAIYLGEIDGTEKVADMWQTAGKDPASGGLHIRDIVFDASANTYNMTNWGDCRFDRFARIKQIDDVAFDILEGGAGLGGSLNTSGLDAAEVDLDAIADEFTFDGMPTTIIYEEQVDIFKWIFDGISGFMDYLAGILISLIKAPVLGYVYFFQLMINSFLHGLN